MNALQYVRLIARFSGHVQGVGFRATTLHYASDLTLHGFVRNEPDGSVLLDADGSRNVLVELLERIQARPAGSIDHVDITWGESLGRSHGFSIG
ncbi:MAG: acylphosphatase [Planctomycetota bacterium]